MHREVVSSLAPSQVQLFCALADYDGDGFVSVEDLQAAGGLALTTPTGLVDQIAVLVRSFMAPAWEGEVLGNHTHCDCKLMLFPGGNRSPNRNINNEEKKK